MDPSKSDVKTVKLRVLYSYDPTNFLNWKFAEDYNLYLSLNGVDHGQSDMGLKMKNVNVLMNLIHLSVGEVGQMEEAILKWQHEEEE